MLVSILSSCGHSMKKFTQNNVRLISNVPFRETLNLHDSKDNLLIRKFTELNEWYVKFTGLDEVKRLQDKVILTQERLEKAQEERRETGKRIVDARKRYRLNQELLHEVKKWENIDRFLELTKIEAQLIKEENDLTAEFEVMDKTERELFTTLSNTVRDSHEKEKAQSEYTKYWGIILSIIGTIVGAVLSTIISTIRNRQIIMGINKNVEEKFDKITSMYDMNKTTSSIDNNFGSLRKESRDFSKLIIENLTANIKEINTLRNENYNFSKQILNQLSKNIDVMNNLVEKSKNRYLLSIDEIKEGDKFVDLSKFLPVQEVQQNNATGLSVMVGIVATIMYCLTCGCLR